jgi:hypothetical protein
MMKTIVLAAALAFTAHASAQTASTPAKKELVAKILKAQQPGIEQMARRITEAPAVQLLQRAGQFVQQRVPADKREATFREAQADARKYVDDTFPFVRERALKLAPTTVGPILEEKMSEDELRQVLAVLESPAWRKYQGLGGDLDKALGEKLVAEVKEHVESRARAFGESMGKRLDAAAGAASAPAAGK